MQQQMINPQNQFFNNPNFIPSNNILINNQYNFQAQIINYQNQINELQKQLYDERNKNNYLYKENENLRKTINNLNNENQLLKNKIKSLESKLSSKINDQQNNSQYDYTIKSMKSGDKILAVNFISMGNNDIGHFNLICKNTDLFVRVEERLYNHFPQFKNYETYFEVNTRRIKRFKTIAENNIKNNDLINIFIVDN